MFDVTNKVMLPTDIRNLIWEFHDEFNMIEKKKRLNYIIRHSYHNWLLDAGIYSRFFAVDEYVAKQDIFPFVTQKIFISNSTQWGFFMNYFRTLEEQLARVNKQCLPSVYSLH